MDQGPGRPLLVVLLFMLESGKKKIVRGWGLFQGGCTEILTLDK